MLSTVNVSEIEWEISEFSLNSWGHFGAFKNYSLAVAYSKACWKCSDMRGTESQQKKYTYIFYFL